MKLTLIRQVVLLLVASSGLAQDRQSALGLPRLQVQGPVAIGKDKFTEEALGAQGGSGEKNGEKKGAKFLILDGKGEWSRPLRGNARGILFVSFAIYGSPDTIIDVSGARLSITAGIAPGCGELMVLNAEGKWQSTGLNIPFDFYDGRILAFMPVLTIRLDPTAGTFDLYQSARLLAEDLPLQPDKVGRKFILIAGSDGAQVNGLVQSDENPLYPDANNNGVDDRFEQAARGKLLASNASKADRQDLIAHWRHDQRTNPAPALLINLPLPDGD